MLRNYNEELEIYLKKYEGFTAHLILEAAEGFNVISKVSNMRFGNCEDNDIAFEKGITLHTYKTIHQFNFSNNDIIDLKFQKAFDETANDTILIEYKSGTCLTFWFEK